MTRRGPAHGRLMARPPDDAPEPLLRRLDADAHLHDPLRHQLYVTTLFEVVAPRYDRFTRVFSLGRDAAWKRELLGALGAAPRDALVLDLACGTGDLALGTAALLPGARIVGLDVSRRMLRLARERARGQRAPLRFAAADVMRLGIRDASVDVVTAGYCLRNTPDFAAALDEIGRVLKPHGRLLTLDFYRPRSGAWWRLFRAYLAVAGGVIGWWWHRQPAAYGYIARSLDRYVTAEAFTAALAARGFAVNAVRRKVFGGVCLHVARRQG